MANHVHIKRHLADFPFKRQLSGLMLTIRWKW
jgi:hypothetical protein